MPLLNIVRLYSHTFSSVYVVSIIQGQSGPMSNAHYHFQCHLTRMYTIFDFAILRKNKRSKIQGALLARALANT